MGQHVFGSIVPVIMGCWLSGHAGIDFWQAASLLGSQTGAGGAAHWPTQDLPEQLPAESHVHVGSLAGQAHLVAPEVLEHPQALHSSLHICPLGQSELVLHPLATLGTHTP